MIDSSYVPLEHPYKIIEYQGTIGIQIGTLIVVRDKSSEDGEYAIETHSHPVVSYVNNRVHQDLKSSKTLFMPKPYEGVVWNKVELKDVTTLVREDETLKWRDFMDYCCKLRLHAVKNHLDNVEEMIFETYAQLLEWGIEIENPEIAHTGERILKVEVFETTEIDGIPYCLLNGDLGIVVGFIDENVAFKHVIEQVFFYMNFMAHFQIDNCRIRFWTQNLFLQDFTSKLKNI